jgi:hypothetical protein
VAASRATPPTIEGGEASWTAGGLVPAAATTKARISVTRMGTKPIIASAIRFRKLSYTHDPVRAIPNRRTRA